MSTCIFFSFCKIFSAKRLTESREAKSKDLTITSWPVEQLILSAALSALVMSRQAMMTLAPEISKYMNSTCSCSEYYLAEYTHRIEQI